MKRRDFILREVAARRERRNDLLFPVGALVLALAAMYLVGWVSAFVSAILIGVILAAAWVREQQVRRTNEQLDVNRDAEQLGEIGFTRSVDTVALEGLPVPVVIIDQARKILGSNQSARKLVGDTAIGKPLSTLIRNPEILDVIERSRLSKTTQEGEYFSSIPVDQYYAVFATPVDADKTALVFHDLTPIKRADRMRADFVANASHELRTPLASLTGFIETLQGPAREDPQAREHFLAIMQEQAARMGRLVSDLLSLSRIELNEHVIPDEVLDLKPIVGTVLDGLIPLAEESGVNVESDVADDLPHIYGDRDQIVQAVQNLLENAIKYGREGKKVRLTLSRSTSQKKMVEIAVRDFGRGIPEEDIPRLTERFYRVNVEDSNKQGGTGLGLAIVKHIVNRHRGTLSIESQSGEGTVFRILLPEARPSDDLYR